MRLFEEDFPTLEEQAVVKLACENSLKVYIKLKHFYNTGSKFVFKDFHNEVIKALEDRLFGKTTKNLIINIPVGFGKSSIIQGFIEMGFARNKNLTFLYTSYSDSLITKHSSGIKDDMLSDFYKRLWNYQFQKDKNSKANWSIDGAVGRSGLTAGSMGGTITGLDAGNPAVQDTFCGAMIIDDPIKATDAISEVARESCIYTYETGLKTRLRRNDVPTILIMQRLHENDLTGYLLKKEPKKWDIITVKALVNEKSIWEEKVSTAELLDNRNDTPWVFYSQYQQEPNSNINTSFKGLAYTDNIELLYDGLGHVDKGFDGEDGTAFTILKLFKKDLLDQDGNVIVKKGTLIALGKLWNKHIDECKTDIEMLRTKYKCGTVYSETNDDKGYFVKNTKNSSGYAEHQNKHFKIMSYLYPAWKHIQFVKETDDAYIKQIQHYNEKSKHDDAPDSLSSAIRLYENRTEVTAKRVF